MLFNTWEFWIFFAILAAMLALCPKRQHNALLLLASYTFYGAWDIRFCGLLAATTVMDYFAAQFASPESGHSGRVRRLALGISVGFNLTVLGIFKYFDFFVGSLGELIAGFDASGLLLGVVLPVGISFYTFQSISYTVDAYRGELRPSKSLRDYALFVSLFPQLVAGPIERATHLLPQVQSERRFTLAQFREGSHLVAWGLFKKVVIADTLAHPANAIFADPSATAPEVYLGVVLFAFQIYCDFSGYTDVARGIAKWLGFDLMLNFNLPYLAKSPADFWRRWHISLSTWLRDYLYIPLGGNRRSAVFTYRNLMITMLLGGLWHGARWNFVLWGLFHGLGLVVHRLIAASSKAPREDSSLLSACKVFAMFHFTLFGWLLFRVEDMQQLRRMVSTLVGGPWALGNFTNVLTYSLPVLLPLFFMQYWQWRKKDLSFGDKMDWPLRTGFVSLCIASTVLLNRSSGSPFIYFQF